MKTVQTAFFNRIMELLPLGSRNGLQRLRKDVDKSRRQKHVFVVKIVYSDSRMNAAAPFQVQFHDKLQETSSSEKLQETSSSEKLQIHGKRAQYKVRTFADFLPLIPAYTMVTKVVISCYGERRGFGWTTMDDLTDRVVPYLEGYTRKPIDLEIDGCFEDPAACEVLEKLQALTRGNVKRLILSSATAEREFADLLDFHLRENPNFYSIALKSLQLKLVEDRSMLLNQTRWFTWDLEIVKPEYLKELKAAWRKEKAPQNLTIMTTVDATLTAAIAAIEALKMTRLESFATKLKGQGIVECFEATHPKNGAKLQFRIRNGRNGRW